MKQKTDSLRRKYPKFIYESFNYEIKDKGLKITFNFLIEPGISFQPEIFINNVNQTAIKKIRGKELNNFVFHLGLMEIPSYWKATCSPQIIVEAGQLTNEQIKWWKNLLIKGMGQFYYENRIDFRKPDFVKIISTGKSEATSARFDRRLKNRYLVPMGGGRDSIVTFEKLKAKKKEVNCFLVNPSASANKVLDAAGIKLPITIERIIDPALLDLNQKGYLNGHTPFTAVLSFLAAFCAVLFDYKNIAFSNEKSADEGNVKYLGKTINHQWAKSSEFEKIFKDYCKKYLAEDISYSSYLRKYTELEISKVFVKYPQYFPVFSSCNVCLIKRYAESHPEAKWCGDCPKCLFVYLTMYPFLKKGQLLNIFGNDIFENRELLPAMKSLLGLEKTKPFECVGTFKESRQAFKLSLAKAKKEGCIPYLLRTVIFDKINNWL